MTAKADFKCHVGLFDLPWVPIVKPHVAQFLLPAVLDYLVEHPVFVPDAVANGKHLKGGKGVHVARCKAAKAPITKAGLHLVVNYLFDVKAGFIKGLCHLVIHVETYQVVGKVRSKEKFGREVAYHTA